MHDVSLIVKTAPNTRMLSRRGTQQFYRAVGASTTFLTPASSPFTRSTTFKTASAAVPRWPSTTPGNDAAVAAVPPAQMKKMRDALTEAAQSTKALQQRLEHMSLALERRVS